jgi:hypothetical protein
MTSDPGADVQIQGTEAIGHELCGLCFLAGEFGMQV